MPTVQLGWSRGSTLDGGSGIRVTEATGGTAPTATIELNVANATSKDEILVALRLFQDKIIQSQNLP
jgi:hypothetical protein